MTKNRRPTRSTAKTLRRTQVLAYLRAHPDFFVQAGSKTNELLERMILPSDDQGNSISLLGYQNRLLAAARDKWIAERQRILDLTATNRVLMEKIHTGCLHLLHTTTLKDFCQQLDTTLIQELHVEHYAFILFTRAPASSFYRHVAQTTMPRAARQLLQKTSPNPWSHAGRPSSACLLYEGSPLGRFLSLCAAACAAPLPRRVVHLERGCEAL